VTSDPLAVTSGAVGGTSGAARILRKRRGNVRISPAGWRFQPFLAEVGAGKKILAVVN